MEISLLALIGISLATMFFGYFFGLFEGRGQGYKRGQREVSLSRTEEPPATAPTPPSERDGDGLRRLLVLRQDAAGHSSVEIDGQLVPALNVTPAARQRMIDLMVMLRPWIDPTGPPAQAGTGVVSRMPPVAPPRSAATPPTTEAANQSTSPGSATPLATQGPPAMSLVQQIDQVLQTRLAGTPLADRGIRLAEAPQGGAIVFIGQTQYDGVDKVDDAEIQGVIRSAIAEWERRYTPG